MAQALRLLSAKHVVHQGLRQPRILSVFSRSRTFNYKPPTDPPHPETPEFPGECEPDWPPKGKIYDKFPWKIELEAEKSYSWCSCGHSKKQPFCDGSHRRLDGTHPIKMVPKHRPVRFKVEETKEYWLCNCKQTGNRPFCDGTHRRQDIQEAIRS